MRHDTIFVGIIRFNGRQIHQRSAGAVQNDDVTVGVVNDQLGTLNAQIGIDLGQQGGTGNRRGFGNVIRYHRGAGHADGQGGVIGRRGAERRREGE